MTTITFLRTKDPVLEVIEVMKPEWGQPLAEAGPWQTVLQHEGIVHRVVGWFVRVSGWRLDRDDLLGYGREGLYLAVVRWNPTRLPEEAFVPFAWKYVKGHVVRGAQQIAGRSRSANYSRPVSIEALQEKGLEPAVTDFFATVAADNQTISEAIEALRLPPHMAAHVKEKLRLVAL